MGGVCCSQDAKAVIEEAFEETFEDIDVQKVLHEIMEDIKAKGVAAAVQKNAPVVAKLAGVAVTELTDAVIDHVSKVVEAKIEAKGVVGTVEELVEDVVEAVAVVRKEAEHMMDPSADAAVVMAVEFIGEKGAVMRADFTSRTLGLDLALSGGGCCLAKGQARVVVKKLESGGQAQALGVRRSWKVASINGVEVTGLEQARRLLAENVAKLPEA